MSDFEYDEKCASCKKDCKQKKPVVVKFCPIYEKGG